MNPIKFRLWYKESQAYKPPFGAIAETYRPLKISSDALGGHLEVEPSESVVVEMFSGLLDSEGEEIYEGDILTGTSFESTLKEVFSFEVFRNWNDYDDSPKDFFRKLKVIGNINQHKHLLD